MLSSRLVWHQNSLAKTAQHLVREPLAEYGLPLCGWAWRGVPGLALAGGGTSRVGSCDRDRRGRGMKQAATMKLCFR